MPDRIVDGIGQAYIDRLINTAQYLESLLSNGLELFC